MSPATDAQISVTVNGEDRTVPDGYPLTDVLRDLEIDPEESAGVAVAINESVIRRQDWDGVTLSEDDTVEVIQAQQGG
jgi:sulfur carrier protein